MRAWSDEEVQELLDKQALNDLLVRYCRGIDRLDKELVLSCFHDDAYDDHGTFKGSAKEFLDQLWSRTAGKAPSFIEHKLSNVSLEIDGDTAYGESYLVMHQLRDGQLIEGYGRFVDRFERRDGVWGIAHRRVVLEWATPGRGYEKDAFVQGSRSRDDPSYERLS
jgi:hypothetical protein